MAEAEKHARKVALGKFTRAVNTLNKLLDAATQPPLNLVEPQFDNLKTVWNALEDAHDDYVGKDENVADDATGFGYLDEPGERYNAAFVRYSAYVREQDEAGRVSAEKKVEADRLYEDERRKREAKELKDAEDLRVREELQMQFQSLKLEVEADSESFTKIAGSLEDSLKDATDSNKRCEWLKAEAEFKKLKEKLVKLVSMDMSQNAEDSQEVKGKFQEAETAFTTFHNWILPQLKDEPVTSGGTSSSASSSSSAKKEAVSLPRFEGSEKKSPFLQYPIWKDQWDKMIVEYPEVWRSRVLCDHVDEVAKSKFIGFESDYTEAMKRLNAFYGDKTKVVACVMQLVNSPRPIGEGDYEGLLEYSVVLESNYTRLKNIGFEHEISNSQAMTSILRKFPRDVTERWNDFLTEKSEAEKMKPFPVFVDWLKSRKETWDRMVTSTDPVKRKGLGGSTFFGETENREKRCHFCKELGHLRRDCPKKKQGGGGSGGRNQKPRPKPKVKKFWCALHKGDASKRCDSHSCQELRKLDPQQRVKLLNENGDCCHCVGDHKAADCNRKGRVCGGDKDDRGCNRGHNVHELFCLEARVFMVTSVNAAGVRSERVVGVFLLIMQVQGKMKNQTASTFFDFGSTSNFVRDNYARRCGFKGKTEELSVTTLGGVTTDLTVMTYTCCLRDVDGVLEYFEAYGIETITGSLSKVGPARLKKMFPHLSGNLIQMLRRGDQVDVLIGAKHASWHPDRAEKAQGDGDLWMYRGKFGSCYGGSCPGIEDHTRKSDNLFHVNQTYHVQCAVPRLTSLSSSHELEFCEKRVELYHQSCASLTSRKDVVVPESPLSLGVVPTPQLSCMELKDLACSEPVSSPCVSVSTCNIPDQLLNVSVSTCEVLDQLSVPVSTSSNPDQLLNVSVGISDVPDQLPAPVSMSNVPDQLLNVSVSTCNVPDQLLTVPVSMRNDPDQLLSVPVSVGSVSDQLLTVPVSMRHDPDQLLNVSVSTCNVPDQLLTVPVSMRNDPDQLLSVPVSVGSVSDQLLTVPVSMRHDPDQLLNVSVSTCNVPDQLLTVPVSMRDDPDQLLSVPVSVSSVCDQFSTVPVSLSHNPDQLLSVSTSTVPDQLCTVPVSVSVVPDSVCSVPEQLLWEEGDESVPAVPVLHDPLSLPLLVEEDTVVDPDFSSFRAYCVSCPESVEKKRFCDGWSCGMRLPSVAEEGKDATEWSGGGASLNFSQQSSHPVVAVSKCFGIKACAMCKGELFFESQTLGVMVEPHCGGCKCGKCPIPGSKFSFKEQQAYDKINSNLYRCDGIERWFTQYPWICSRNVLPKNKKAALQNLLSLERTLSRNQELAEDFSKQIEDMVSRGAAVILSEEELDAWEGAYYYLPMVGVKGKKQWLRVCFDASRKQGGYPSLNDCLYKGPDGYINNLLSVIIGFRNGRIGAAADISKFHNQVYLCEEDMHMQRFLWRKMDTEAEPVTYAMRVNNFGVVAANTIATCALHRSADHFADEYPVESRDMKEQTYVDDQLVAAACKGDIMAKTARLDEIAKHAGMPNKGWIYSGDVVPDFPIGDDDPFGMMEKVLGLSWVPNLDVFVFRVVLKFLCGKEEILVDTEKGFLAVLLSIKLTRRIVLANVARIFDPVGFLAPIILYAKLLMRESWNGPLIGWDDPLPDDQVKKWVAFLSSLLMLRDVEFPRSLWPAEEVVGLPVLIVFSDGSVLAYGACAYIRWQLAKGGYWTQLIMAKCKVAPKHIVSIPRMELNGAVLGNRIKNFLVKETNLEFGAIYHLVDSSTVLGYLQKECGKFRPYEGVRIAEIQSSNEMKNGRLVGWAWVSGGENPADWCTKPRKVEDLVGGFWMKAADFLARDEAEWPIKYSYKKDALEGELHVPRGVYVTLESRASDALSNLLARCGSWKKAVRVLARMMRWRSKDAGHLELNAEEIYNAKVKLVVYAQKDMVEELKQAKENGTGRYRKLAPMVGEDGTWRVGSRLKNFVPFTFDKKLPFILPPDHRITLLVMQESHQVNHGGQDSTLSRFRAMGFWTIRGGHLAKSVKKSCVPCRKVDAKTDLTQPMGEFPADVHTDPVAWGWCQMDLFGHFSCRGDVNPRTTKKTWRLIIEDINSGAIHIDIVQDYSAEAVLLSLRRFGGLRGWPGVLQSDPGSQLVSASGKLVEWWKDLESPLRKFAGTKNFQWKVSPPDSPWRQGKAERRIAIVKRLLRLSIGDTRVTPVELQTVFFEIANICNERPIGLSRPRDDGTYDIITPNHLLLGRSCNILPDDASLVSQLPVASRYRLVHHITSMFWQKWSTNVSPGLIVRQKWHESSRNLKVGDLVMIMEQSVLKSKYKLGVVDSTHPSDDGYVRSVTLRYVNVQTNNGAVRASTVFVKRSVQRLVMILPVEEQVAPVVVEDHEHFCCLQLRGESGGVRIEH